MDFNRAREYCLNKPECHEDFPFGPGVHAFKVADKLFAILSLKEGVGWLNLKCDPDQALALRDIFKSVIPGYHMNKKHWNTVILDGDVPAGEIERMVDHSFGLVVKGLSKAVRNRLILQHGEQKIFP